MDIRELIRALGIFSPEQENHMIAHLGELSVGSRQALEKRLQQWLDRKHELETVYKQGITEMQNAAMTTFTHLLHVVPQKVREQSEDIDEENNAHAASNLLKTM